MFTEKLFQNAIYIFINHENGHFRKLHKGFSFVSVVLRYMQSKTISRNKLKTKTLEKKSFQKII